MDDANPQSDSPIAGLSPAHYASLKGSAIADEVIRARGYLTLDSMSGHRLLKARGFGIAQCRTTPGLVLPLWRVDGSPGHISVRNALEPLWVFRPDVPRVTRAGRPVKYEIPQGAAIDIDCPPASVARLGDPTVPLWITEGQKKGDALVSQGACALALLGVWNWRGTSADGGIVALPAWNHVALNGRQAVLAFDSDITTKAPVRKAMDALAAWLSFHGAIVSVCQLPGLSPDGKTGIDDYFAGGHTLHDAAGLCVPWHSRAAGAGTQTADDALPDDGRPVIRLSDNIPAMLHETLNAILRLPPQEQPYVHADGLTHVASGRPFPVRAYYLQALASRAATFIRHDERSKVWRRIAPPLDLARGLLECDAWPGVQPLLGVTTTPILRPDGHLHTTQGYDPLSQLFYCPAQPFPDWGTGWASQARAQQALASLDEVFQDFLYDDQELGRSVTLAALLTCVGRHLILGPCPLFGVTATVPGSGKGLIINAIGLIATGESPAACPQITEEEEERKRLLAFLASGRRIVHLDNCTRRLGGGILEPLLTSEIYEDRELGKSVTRRYPARTVWFASGQNLQYRGDMARRVLPLRLDPQCEHPERRGGFAHTPLLSWVSQEFPRLAVDALALLSAFLGEGTPQPLPDYGSYESWSGLVRQALVWLGLPDPLEAREAIEEEADADYESLQQLMTAWEDCYDDRPILLRNMLRDIAHGRAMIGAPGNKWDDLQEAILAIISSSQGKAPAVALGYALAKWQGRILRGRRFVRDGQRTRHGYAWRLAPLIAVPF